jgi:lactoylglutathione lyase
MIKAQFKYTILYVKDVAATIKFYTKAFGLEAGFITPEADYGEVITGNTTLSFANLELGNSNIKSGFIESHMESKPFGIELAFVTENIEETWNQATSTGATILEPIETKVWGQQVGYLRDPNGFLLEICTPMKM